MISWLQCYFHNIIMSGPAKTIENRFLHTCILHFSLSKGFWGVS